MLETNYSVSHAVCVFFDLESSVSSNPVTQLEIAPQVPACGDTDSPRAGRWRSSRSACHGKAPVSVVHTDTAAQLHWEVCHCCCNHLHVMHASADQGANLPLQKQGPSERWQSPLSSLPFWKASRLTTHLHIGCSSISSPSVSIFHINCLNNYVLCD